MRQLARVRATAGVILTLLVGTAAVAKLETWRQDSPAAFGKGKKDRVVVSDAGRIRLGRSIRSSEKLEAARIWDLARSGDATLYAASGDSGQFFRRKADQLWEVAHDAADSQALSLAVLPDGRVFGGTGPSGMVIEVSKPGAEPSRPGPEVQYVWDLASDSKGNLYAATGPNGQLWKRSSEGSWSLAFDARQSHLLCLAIGRVDEVYIGTDGDGLIYRVEPEGKVQVIYDADQSDVRTLLMTPEGILYAGTAAESGGSSSRTSARSLPSESGLTAADTRSDRDQGSTEVAALPAVQAEETPKKSAPRRDSGSVEGGTAAPRSVSPGENAVYRFGADKVAREIFRARVLIHALAWQGDRLLIGTGPEGTIYEVERGSGESAPVARLDHGQILSLLAEPGGPIWIGAGDPGAVLALEPGFVATGSLVSEVLDAKLPSRFGAVGWRAETPEGTSVSLQVRTGNVGEPDATWSDWSSPQTDPSRAVADARPGRFAQYRLTLRTDSPTRSPEVRSVYLRYQSSNLRPEISKLEVPDVTAGDGATRQSKLTLRWDASDPNGDDLAYRLAIRKDGWPDWIRIGGVNPLTDTRYEWDTTAVPAGLYQVKVTATDRPSNPADATLESNRISDPFVVDHQPPAVVVTYDRARKRAEVQLSDSLTRLASAAYSLDGGDWIPAFPVDGLFDTEKESIPLPLPDLEVGTHVLMVRASDAAGNLGTGDTVLVIE